MTKPFIVGLTGGIGCGKSTVSKAFSKLGVKIIDTDLISRNLTSAGGEGIKPIRQVFGDKFILPDGSLDRNLMRTTVFKNPSALANLESILHPLIRAKVQDEIAQCKDLYVILVIPLLIEKSGYTDVLNRILVVDCDKSIQIQRVMNRNGLDETAVKNIMRNQANRNSRLSMANDVIDNSSNPEALTSKVKVLHALYLSLAKN